MAVNKLSATSGKILCKLSELRLDITLACGQSFRWQETSRGVWRSVLAGRIWSLSQDSDAVHFTVWHNDKTGLAGDAQTSSCLAGDAQTSSCPAGGAQTSSCLAGDAETSSCLAGDAPTSSYTDILHDYFQLDVKLEELYAKWTDADLHFSKVAGTFKGVRMLRQDPVENLFSFICSSNNHISRISGMVEKLCTHYGPFVGELDGKDYYAFPTINALAKPGMEQNLRDLGFGYRAKYISQTAQYIDSHHSKEWLQSLRNVPYEQAKSELVKLCGVGAKVADCVCLMSLDKTGAIPVDTHVWQIASRDYMPKLKQAKSLTSTIYAEIGDNFRDLWGEYAGWAHSVLFSADLKKFQELKPEDLQKSKSEEGKTVKRKASSSKNATKRKKKH